MHFGFRRIQRLKSTFCLHNNNPASWFAAGTSCKAGIIRNFPKIVGMRLPNSGIALRGMLVEHIINAKEISAREISELEPDERHWANRISERDITDSKCRLQSVAKDGRVAYLPPSTKAEDAISVILGFPVPFVLRPVNNGWRLIGECYIPWIMEGQALMGVDTTRALETEPTAPPIDFRIY